MLEAKLNQGRNDEDPAGQSDGSPDARPPWAAPHATTPVHATVALPGSKSLTGRELILSALATAPSIVRSAPRSRDSQLMIEALRALGTDIVETDTDIGLELSITPAAELTGSTTVACGLAGTVMRFVPPLAALALGPTAFDGDPYARRRPMRPLIDALRALGADIADEGRGALPFTVHGSGSLRGGRVEIDASLSSQFVSALLLSAPRFDEGVHLVHIGAELPSLPHIDMTLAALRARGVTADSPAPHEWRVAPGPIAARDLTVEPDLSNAAPFLAAAIATGGSVTIPAWPAATTQVGDQLREILPAFGATVEFAGDQLTVHGGDRITGVELHIPEAGELAPTLLGLAALAAHGSDDSDGGEASRITGIGHIRHHETDRIAALVAELRGLGGEVEELDDGIAIRPAQLSAQGANAGVWHAYADHRMATTGALIGLRVPGIAIDDIASTSKTMPDFPTLWARMLGLSSPTGTHGGYGTGAEGAAGELPSNGAVAANGLLSGLFEAL